MNTKPSAIFDMESFLWTLVFVPLYQNRKTLVDWDARWYRALVSNVQPYQSNAKARLLSDLLLKGTVRKNSVLKPYEELLRGMATLARQYYEETVPEEFDSFDFVQEVDAIEKYILVVETFLRQERSVLG